MKLQHTYALLASVLIFISCKPDSPTIDSAVDSIDVEAVCKKYPRSSINYFYEVIFYSETDKKQTNLKRWQHDVHFGIAGDTLSGDFRYVQNAVLKLNELGLPITIDLVKDVDGANAVIHFGDSASLRSRGLVKGALGMGNIHESHNKKGLIDSAIILIVNDRGELRRRESAILEEMTQVLGVIGDSYRYPESLFYEAYHIVSDFNQIDADVIRMLYDSLIPLNYSRHQFERDFASVLNYVNTTDKIREKIQNGRFSMEVLEEIRESAYIKNDFHKHANNVIIYLDGVSQQDSFFVQKVVHYVNTLSPQLKMHVKSKQNNPVGSGIQIMMVANEGIDYDSETRITNKVGQTFKTKRMSSAVTITYRSSIDLFKKYSVIAKAIYKSLGPTETKNFDENWLSYDGETVKFSKKYEDVLKVIYLDEFVDGYPAEELDELIQSL